MSKPLRYLLYFGIGLGLYFFLEWKDGGQTLESVHQVAPMIILGVVAVMVILKIFVERKRKKNE
jgi:hypothetical protein